MSFLSSLFSSSSSSSEMSELDKSRFGFHFDPSSIATVECRERSKGDRFPDSIWEPPEHAIELSEADVRLLGKLTLRFARRLSDTIEVPLPSFMIDDDDSVASDGDGSAGEKTTSAESTEDTKCEEDISDGTAGVNPDDSEQSTKKKTTKTMLKYGNDLLLRYIVGYAHITNEEERFETTAKHMEDFFKAWDHYKCDTLLIEKGDSDEAAKEDDSSIVTKIPKSVPLSFAERVARAWPVAAYGFDKFGHPVFYDRMGMIQAQEISDIVRECDESFEAIFTVRFQLILKMRNMKTYLSMKYNRLIFKHCVVLDFKGLDISWVTDTRARRLCQSLITTLTNLFPETAYKVFVLNMPSVMVTAYNYVFIHFVDPYTRKKVTILSPSECEIIPCSSDGKLSQPSKLIELMTEYIDIDQIPQRYGGKNELEMRSCDFPLEYYSIQPSKDSEMTTTLSLKQSFPFEMPKMKIHGTDRFIEVAPML